MIIIIEHCTSQDSSRTDANVDPDIGWFDKESFTRSDRQYKSMISFIHMIITSLMPKPTISSEFEEPLFEDQPSVASGPFETRLEN